jgi:hypothetical protein
LRPRPHSNSSNAKQAHSAQNRATAARAPCTRPNWRSGRFWRGAETGSPPHQNLPLAQLAGSHGAQNPGGQSRKPDEALLWTPPGSITSGCSRGPKRPPRPASGLRVGCLPLQRCLGWHPALGSSSVGLGRNGRETDATWRFSNRFGRTRSQTTREGVQ